MLIDTLTGSENFPGMTAKAHLFVVPCRAFPNPKGEAHIASAAKAGSYGVRKHSGGASISAGIGMPADMGFFTQTQYDIEQGVILKLFVMKRVGTQPLRTASQFIRLREGAALNRIEIPLTGHTRASLQTCFIEGRFDFVSVAAAEKAGVSINPMHRRGFDVTQVRGLMNLRVLSGETQAAPVLAERSVVNSDGQSVQVVSRASKRMLDV